MYPAEYQSSNANYQYDSYQKQESQQQAYPVMADPESGNAVAYRPDANDGSGGGYFRRHRVTAPFLMWMDFFEPDTRRRWLKAPHRVKWGLSAEADRHLRRKYAMQKIRDPKSGDGPGLRQRDGFDRIKNRKKDERYISAYDGALKELVVQCTDDLFYTRNDAHWGRARITDLAGYSLRVADWCAWQSTKNLPTGKRVLRRLVGGILICFPVSSTLGASTMLLTSFFQFNGGSLTPHKADGMYEGFHYRLHGYAKVASNPLEEADRFISTAGASATRRLRLTERTMGPSKLCKITWNKDGNPQLDVITTENVGFCLDFVPTACFQCLR